MPSTFSLPATLTRRVIFSLLSLMTAFGPVSISLYPRELIAELGTLKHDADAE